MPEAQESRPGGETQAAGSLVATRPSRDALRVPRSSRGIRGHDSAPAPLVDVAPAYANEQTLALDAPTLSPRRSRGTAQCDLCERGGLLFPGDEWRCFQHASPAQEQLVDDLDIRAPGIGLLRPQGLANFWGDLYGWPYGPNIDVAARSRMLDWAEANGLRRSRRAHACVQWLRTSRCNYDCGIEDRHLAPGAAWMDHLSSWTRNGQPAVLVAQPYALSGEDVEALGVLSEEPGLRLEVRPPGTSWYGWGTWFVGVWRADA